MELNLMIRQNNNTQPQAPEIHPALERIIKYVDLYTKRQISEIKCLELTLLMLARIKVYNANISKLNINIFKEFTDLPSPIFHKIDLDQRYENGKNLLDYVLPSPHVTLLLIQKGLFSKNAILYCIKNHHIISLDLLLKRLTKYGLPENGIEYNFYMQFLKKILFTSIKDGTDASFGILCRHCKKYFHLMNNKPLVQTIMYNKHAKFDMLVQSGMNIQNEFSETNVSTQFSPVETSCIFKKYIFLKKLIDLGADINVSYFASPLTLTLEAPFLPQYSFFAERNLTHVCMLLIKRDI